MKSIRQRLLLWQLGALVIAAALEGLISYQLAWDGFNRSRDSVLQSIAYSVVRHGMRPAPDHASPQAPTPNPPDGPSTDLGHFTTQIWTTGGQLIYSSLAAGGPPLQSPGLNVASWNGEDWRIYTLVEREQVVQVAVTAADRLERFGEILPGLLVPLGVLVLVIWLLMHAAVRNALAPLNAWGRDLRHREGGDLRAVGTQALPEELVPLGEALNQLLSRVEALLGSQRTLLADVAHELNTPLAAVKLQAQIARRSGDATREAALDELDRGIERATHLVAQLLQMARLEPGVRERRPAPLRLDTLAAEVVAAFSARADARGIDLGLAPSEAAWVPGDEEDLRVLLNNLVDNALRHVPAGGRVDVQVTAEGGRVRLGVSDTGPGIPEADRERVLRRFVRLNPSHEDGQGSGLGLSIVARVVAQHGATLALDEREGGGLSVRIDLPAAAPSR
ncbi:MAG TPA: HAMP domain-containing sensor histidine kinase [Hydrogenophaga sp.]|uniref:sensor histidine kinase n=1 Tax=Hydrogenophaga sp. TaxID=1904254 RepID=UPI002CFCD0F0|nr:HAMP domain-containing sensor histidine kinase [Hydrogenophaga sp.]HSX94724.1 HAMP domain-containing sensor histidine kinase [Hydrogenophaga sp.]